MLTLSVSMSFFIIFSMCGVFLIVQVYLVSHFPSELGFARQRLVLSRAQTRAPAPVLKSCFLLGVWW